MQYDMDVDIPTNESACTASGTSQRSESQSIPECSEPDHTSTGHSSSSATANNPQSSVLLMLKNEIENRRYWSTTRHFIEHFIEHFPSLNPSASTEPPLDYRKILESIHKGITSLSGHTPYPLPLMPKSGSPERSYYEPLTSWIQSVKDSSPILSKAEINFFPYDKTMKDSADGSWALKPDGLGAAKEEKCMEWKNVRLAIEVKSDDAKAFLQAASYARSMLAARPGLRYAVILTFNHRKNRLIYHVFSHSCISSSVPLDISTVGGYRSFVRITVAFLSALAANEDHSQDSNFMLIPNHLLRVDQILTNRICVIGRATRVVRGHVVESVEGQEPNNDSQHLSSEVNINSSEKGEDDGEGDKKPEEVKVSSDGGPGKRPKGAKKAEPFVAYCRGKLSIHYTPKDAAFENIINNKSLIVKDSWPPVNDAMKEANILSMNEGKWGVAQIYTGYQTVPYRLHPVCAPAGARLGMKYTGEEVQREALEEEKDAMPDDPSSMGTSGSGTVVFEAAIPLARTHVRIVFKTEGVPLTKVMDDKFRVKAILDAVIGHYGCFESGWLHGDVSIGNVLCMLEGSSGSLPKCFEKLGWKVANGVLIDFDLAVPWEDESKSALTQSGTLPFMPLSLLSAWRDGFTRLRLPADDLESFSWLWLWTLFSIGRHNNNLSIAETRWFTLLEAARDYATSFQAKAVILHELENSEQIHNLMDYPIRREGYRLFRAWFKICEDHQIYILRRGSLNSHDGSARSESAVIEEEREKLYMKFIERGVEYMGCGKSSVTDDVPITMEE